jgi:hypothetical protein
MVAAKVLTSLIKLIKSFIDPELAFDRTVGMNATILAAAILILR